MQRLKRTKTQTALEMRITMFKLSMPPVPIETPRVLFDLSRLLRSRDRTFATGVDRIDLAIGRNLLTAFGKDCHFLYAGPFGMAVVSQALGSALLNFLEARWNGMENLPEKSPSSLRITLELALKRLRGVPHDLVNGDTTYVVASHSGLGKIRGGMRSLDPNASMRRVVYIHDLIPLDMPEYQRPQTRDSFLAYLRELTDAPLCVASNSYDTDARIHQIAARENWPVEKYLVLIPTIEHAPDSVSSNSSNEVAAYLADDRPFFTILGTIEPRKNHLLLLNIWRQMVHEGTAAPRLCIIGKRGWENENVVDMLERCDTIKGVVKEFGDLADHDVQLLVRASNALLFPSFIEGLGIPLLEAAALGVPCIVSDIPVFREAAPQNTIFLDPLDGPGWKNAILKQIQEAQV